jgi:hypothetical protein
MWSTILDRRTSSIAIALALLACDKSKGEATPEPAPPASVSAAPDPEPAPQGCQAGAEPVVLDKTDGYVYDIGADATHLYYGRWQLYGGRGDLRRARKDGKGGMNLASLSLEPRGVVVDADKVYFTAGIRLMTIPKEGGEPKALAKTFSSLSLTDDDKYIYGVPGDYGPYDRLVRADKGSGKTYELDVSERPDVSEQPRGFSAVAADADSIYVTDSSADRVLRFSHERAKPKVLSAKQPKAFALGIDADSVYFTLALKGDLMKIAKSGGAAKKLASGLMPNATIAVDQKGLVTTLQGKDKDAPATLAAIPKDGGDAKPLASVPNGNYVEVIALDDKCVYWVQREAGAGTTVYARAR